MEARGVKSRLQADLKLTGLLPILYTAGEASLR